MRFRLDSRAGAMCAATLALACASDLEPPGGTQTGDAGTAPPALVDAAPDAVPPDPQTRTLIGGVLARITLQDVQSLMATLQEMSQPNRVTGSDNYRRATEWIRALVQQGAPAAEIRFDEHGAGAYRNVEIKLPGSDPSAGLYLLGGHLDSVRRSPGADDNASGALGAAIVARALGAYRFKAEIRVVLFDAEEIGLEGSRLYAQALFAGGCRPDRCLRYFINMDMIGFDPMNRRRVRVLTAVPPIAQLFATVADAHDVGLTVLTGGDGCNASDDCSFTDLGYQTGYVTEATPFELLHTPRDTNDVINFDSMTRTLHLVAAALATSAGVEGPR